MIALGDELGADDDVDQPALDIVDELGRLGGRPQGIGGDDGGSGFGKARRHLVGDALDAGAARDEAVLILAFGTEPRRRHDMAAMMAGEPVDERSEEHTSELQSLMRISYAVFCLKKKKRYNEC